MNYTGPLKKLASKFMNPIAYALAIGDQQVELNPVLGQHIEIEFLQEIFCIQCQRKTAKSFQQGYCYPCYKKLLDCNLCMIHPERCKHPQETCPDTWEHAHCTKEHIVYMANSSGLKVGITRDTQVPTRWIDQGAIQAIPLFKVKNRFQSGQIEVTLKKYITDKTNWRKMLHYQDSNSVDMQAAKSELLNNAQADLAELFSNNLDVEILDEGHTTLNYPILELPKKLTAVSLDKEPRVSGKLIGIKGQYLLFEDKVMNIRKHGGYRVSVTVGL
jgi:hypothetical protein